MAAAGSCEYDSRRVKTGAGARCGGRGATTRAMRARVIAFRTSCPVAWWSGCRGPRRQASPQGDDGVGPDLRDLARQAIARIGRDLNARVGEIEQPQFRPEQPGRLPGVLRPDRGHLGGRARPQRLGHLAARQEQQHHPVPVRHVDRNGPGAAHFVIGMSECHQQCLLRFHPQPSSSRARGGNRRPMRPAWRRRPAVAGSPAAVSPGLAGCRPGGLTGLAPADIMAPP